MTDDSDTQDTQLYCARINANLYHGSVWGADAVHKGLKKYFSGRNVVHERVDAVPVTELERIADRMEKNASSSAQYYSKELRELIEKYE